MIAVSDETLVENSISRYGLRTMEFIQFGSPPDAKVGMDLVPGDAIDLVKIHRTVEEPLGIHHLTYTWQAREMVEFQRAPVRYAVLWWIEKGERMSWAIELAACLYRLQVGRYPTMIWVNKIPKGAPATYEIEGIKKEEGEIIQTVVLKEAFWVPERFVCVGIELNDFDPVFDVKTGKYDAVGTRAFAINARNDRSKKNGD